MEVFDHSGHAAYSLSHNGSHCTCSRCRTALDFLNTKHPQGILCQGDHTVEAYSIWGWTKVLYKPRPIMLKILPISYAFEQCSKKLPIMLNIMPITTTIMPQFIYSFIIFND